MKIKIAAILFASSVLSAGVASAQSPQTDTLGVTAKVVEGCGITNTTDVAFGTLVNRENALDRNGSVEITCNQAKNIEIALNNGQHYANTTRNMSDGGSNTLPYALYRDSARSQPWTSTDTLTAALTANQVANYTVYGRIPASAGAALQAGNYTDTVQITLTFN